MKALSARVSCACTPLLLLTMALSFGTSPTRAATVPGLEAEVELRAREQPVEHFLQELFGQIGKPVRVSDEVRGLVNGDFVKSAASVSHDIMKSFQLSMYYDGAVVHVYPSNEVSRSILPVSSRATARIMNAARDLGLTDPQNVLSKASNGGLMVTGAKRFVEQIEELSYAVQQGMPAEKAPGSTYRVFRLKYAWADDVSLAVGGQTIVVPGVASLIRSLIEPGGISAPARTRQQIRPSVSGLRGQGLNAVGDAVEEPAPVFESSGSSAAHPNNARIVADSRLNALIVRDTANRMPMYESLIASLDVEPTMLEIEATIIDMDTDRLRELGINWRLQDGDSEALLGPGSARAGRVAPGTVPVGQAGQGGVVSLVVGDRTRFISRIRALETQGAARIVSKPHIITLSDVEAVLDTTSTFFVRVAGQEEVDLFNVSVGTTLRVTPHVFDEGARSRIKLLVNIEDGSASDRQVDSIPVIERSTINTQALIDAGESLLIGGLVREFTGNAVSKVPVLGDIPGLGALFRNNSRTSSRVERLFLITPRLSRQPGEVRRFSAPVLHGSEADILSSAPARLAGVSEALARRDAQYPVSNDLPAAGSSVSLTSPAARAAADRADAAVRPEPRSRELTVRERLLGLSPSSLASAPVPRPQAVRRRVPAVQSLQAGRSQSASPEEWTAVHSSNTGAGFSRTAIGRAPVGGAATGRAVVSQSVTALDNDGWQEVR